MSSETAPSDISFDRTPVGPAGTVVALTPLVRRLVANNPGPMTFTGTCTYVVGQGTVALIDPGPDLPEHVAALAAALRGETVRHILVTHTHRDHCGGAARLKAMTGATILGCAPHKSTETPAEMGTDDAHDLAYAPDVVLGDGDRIALPGASLEAVATPGHTGNHLCFALPAEQALFSGDHVMAWSTSVVIPPDGSMADYMASLEKLQSRGETIYWPGHGAPVGAPQAYVAALIRHRRRREAEILAALRPAAMTIPELLGAIYPGLDPALRGAAALSLRAHLDDLIRRGLVQAAAD